MKTAVVIGAGTMGAGIAEVLARAGLQTTLCDRELALAEAGLEKVRASLGRAVQRGKLDTAEPVLARLQTAQGLGPPADLVVEAVYEELELKKSVLGELSRRSEATLLGSNTSSLSLTEIASACQAPERVIGLHFFNPAPVMALLEVVRAEQTSPQTLDRALELALRLGKTPVVVRDVAGFATSRLGILLGMEAIRMVESQVASAADIDRAMELGYRHPMGPLKLTDLVGLDVRLAIAEHLTREIGPQFTPPPLLRRLVRAGYLGKKTGRGFYRWEGEQALEDC
ncbi:MAG: putative 3-hydroxyacyl-CoA dehydrogenase [Candidatus Xenobia bacterium]